MGFDKPRVRGTFGVIAALAALLSTAPEVAAQVGGEIRSAKSGVYTEAQAEAGLSTYQRICAKCHNEGSPLEGSRFLVKWTGRPLYALWEFMSTRMPYDAPGSLSPEQYAEVLAYVLKLNRYPAGTEPLPHLPLAVANIDLDPPPPLR